MTNICWLSRSAGSFYCTNSVVMTMKFSMKFVLIFVYVLSIQQVLAPPSDNIMVYVVAIANSSSSADDVEVEVLSQNQPYQEPQTVNGQRLPSECVFGSNDSLQCSSMLDISNKSAPNGPIFILAPLMEGVLIQKFIHEDMLLRSVQVQPLPIQSCSPVIMLQATVVPDYKGVFVLCKSLGLLSLVQLVIDYSDLSKSKAYSQGSYVIDPTPLSNFIEVTSTDETSIVFINNNRLYQLDLEEGYFTSIGYLPPGSCVPVSYLLLVSDTLLAYCSDSSVVYFESDGTFLNQTNPLTDGIPLVCPDPDVRLAIFSGGDYIKVGLWSKSTYFQINLQTDIYSSVCLGNKTALHFVYTNATGSHVFTINLLQSTSNTTLTLDTNSCKNGACKPLMVFYNRWLLLQVILTFHDSSVMVFDSSNGFAMVLKRLHVDNFAVETIIPLLESPAPIPSLVTESSMNVSPSGPAPPSSITPKPFVTGIVLPCAVVFIGVVALIFLALWYRKRHKQNVAQGYQEMNRAIPETNCEQGAIQESDDQARGQDQDTTYASAPIVNTTTSDNTRVVTGLSSTAQLPGQTATLSSEHTVLSLEL